MSAQGAALGTMFPKTQKPQRGGPMIVRDDRIHAAVIIQNQPAQRIQHKAANYAGDTALSWMNVTHGISAAPMGLWYCWGHGTQGCALG